MIKSLKLKNFRNFETKDFIFDEEKNFIIGDNGVGKTNILESICLIYQKNLINKDISNLVNKNENYAFIEIENDNQKFSISYDKNTNTKNLLINGKKTTKKKFEEMLEKIIIFKPMDMNMMYLSPSYRRDFIDDILSNSFPSYERINKNYKNIIRNRNKLLKSIKDGKATKNDIKFWDGELIKNACLIYEYRNKLNNFFIDNINIIKELLTLKNDSIIYKYVTKVDLNSIELSISNYLTKNIDRDIIIGNTHIGPHIDDFEIQIDSFPLVNYASRGETKSVIIGLKILESRFIEKHTNKKTIFIIDDLFSEIDKNHEILLLNEIKDKQTFITSISSQNDHRFGDNIINL
ncbi:DNA replication and repair protein RecF [Candidatus Gracilibacteria bacterium]|nr:DNA replication and repair protein RecF [Candidatus Gracilibacteria bacterium]